jgi:hypothetical protein
MPLDLKLTPDTTEIKAILARQITGPYRFVHHALVPYVRVGPAFPDQAVTLTHSKTLRLQRRQACTLHGLEHTMDFAVMFEGRGVVLMEVSSAQDRARAQALLAPFEVPMLPKFDEKASYGFQYKPGGEPLAVPAQTAAVPAQASQAAPQEHAMTRVHDAVRELNDVLRYAKHVGLRSLITVRNEDGLPQIGVDVQVHDG